MRTPSANTWSAILTLTLVMFVFGCSGNNVDVPTLPNDDVAIIPNNIQTDNSPGMDSQHHESWGYYNMVLDEENMTIDIVQDKTVDTHFNVTWVKDICPQCITAKVVNFDINTRIFDIQLITKNPTQKVGADVRFIIDLDGTDEYMMMDPDDWTKLFSMTGEPNPFRALAIDQPKRLYLPAQNDVTDFKLWISASHTPIANIPFIIDVSFPGNCAEPYTITDVNVDGEFPPGGGGSVDVSCVVWHWFDDWGEVWLRTDGIFTTGDVQMSAGSLVGDHGREFTATVTNTVGGGAGLVDILIEAYYSDQLVEPFPLNEYATIYADPGGASAIAGDVFNALTKLNLAGTVNIKNQGGGPDPPPVTVTDGAYYQTVLAGTYSVEALNNLYFLQDTIADVIVPADTTVLVCFGLAPKWLDDPDEALATISGVILDGQTGDPILGAQATLDGGAQTGGIIQSRITDSRGHYCFYAVPTFQQTNWTVNAFHSNYLPDSQTDVPSAINKATAQVDFLLTPLNAEDVWFENFEAGPSNVGTQQDWTFTRVQSETMPDITFGMTTYHDQTTAGDILWHVQDPGTNPSQDNFYPAGICSLPPDDTSDGWIPDAFEGHRYMWYGEELDNTGGQPHSGTFIDEWSGSTSPGGWSSNSNNAGTARTGPIDLSAQTDLTMTFQVYWEIESVDPSIQYDAIDVLISKDGTAWDLLDRLNPLSEPIPDDPGQNAPIPYTSSGFNQAAVWSPGVYDLSNYAGESTVYLRFDFDTIDSLYNGFRGAIVDNIRILPFAIS
ncbi:MAG TPA: hypothetical protein VGB30_11930 [bacterium]|jgi:hypothetical protein